MQMAGEDRQFAGPDRKYEQVKVFRFNPRGNPHNYPQTRATLANACFYLRLANDELCSLSDRSRLVLPNVTIAKVKLAWV
jgi:hypothetical protein